jgi:hypothetical protein
VYLRIKHLAARYAVEAFERTLFVWLDALDAEIDDTTVSACFRLNVDPGDSAK